MSLLVALRTDVEFEQVKAFVDHKAYGGFCVREVVDNNEHWHWLLDVPSSGRAGERSAAVRLQAFRVALTRAVPGLKGNAAYSATEVKDVEKYERYMCKGESDGVGPQVCWRNSLKYLDDKLDELHVAYWETNRTLKKRTAGSMVDFVVEEAKRLCVDWKDRRRLGKIYAKEVCARRKPLNIFAAKSCVNAVQCLLCPDDEAFDMIGALCEV